MNLEDNLIICLNEQLKREEILWKQKSRLQWLTTMDLNTKFFHLSSTMRRKRNQILSLKDHSNRWVHDTHDIYRLFLEDFQAIYQSSGSIVPNDLDELFPIKISNLDNELLCCIPDEEEILSTLEQTPLF